MPGTDATAANAGLDFDLYIARSINGVAPPTLGTTNAAMNVISATAAKPYIIAYQGIDGSVLEDSGDGLVGYNMLGGGVTAEKYDRTVIEGEPAYASTEGYQTIWVAGVAQGAYNFGTACLLDGAILTGAAGAQALDVSEDTDADDVFAVGDELLACAANGTSVQTIGTVTAVAADTVTVDAKDIDGTAVWESGALADDDEICFRRPLTLHLGLEY